jgi:hypothetical protein
VGVREEQDRLAALGTGIQADEGGHRDAALRGRLGGDELHEPFEGGLQRPPDLPGFLLAVYAQGDMGFGEQPADEGCLGDHVVEVADLDLAAAVGYQGLQ